MCHMLKTLSALLVKLEVQETFDPKGGSLSQNGEAAGLANLLSCRRLG